MTTGVSPRYQWLIFLALLIMCQLSMPRVAGALPLKRTATNEYSRYVKYPEPDPAKGPISDLVKEGEYLAKVGDCAACHTSLQPDAKTFAGGLGIKTPFGTIYSPNITPDEETGIGTWSDEDFLRAMHTGVAKGGKHLFPVFPYIYFTKVTKHDALAIKAYLFSLKPVHSVERPNQMPFPFSWRFLQVGWRLLFFDFQHSPFEPKPEKGELWNRGAYLVQGLGHCGMCHTPLNALGAAKNRYYLTGGLIDGYATSNISSAGLHKLSVEDVAKVLRTGRRADGSYVGGPMMEVEHNSLQYFTDNDLLAVATYLKTVKSEAQPTKAMTFNPADLAQGKAVYEKTCKSCHELGSAGAPKYGDAVAWAPRIKKGMDQLTHSVIHGLNAMPAKGLCNDCTDQQLHDAVEYIVNASQPKAGQTITIAPKGKKPEGMSLARGEHVYLTHCASCHADGKGGAPVVGNQRDWEARVAIGPLPLLRNAIDGYRSHPKRGGCVECTDGDIISATVYMVDKSSDKADLKLWLGSGR